MSAAPSAASAGNITENGDPGLNGSPLHGVPHRSSGMQPGSTAGI